MSVIQETERYTYKDYLQWDDGERWELIDGIPYNMSPAPIPRHQLVSGWILTELRIALRGKKCIPFDAPTDVVLSEHDIVQPDVFAVCDHEKITEKNVQGAPDLIFEVLSSATNRHDRWDKKRLYEMVGVKEYIIVDLEGGYSEHYLLQDSGNFDDGHAINFDESLELKTIENLSLVLQEALNIPPFNQEKSG